MSFPNSKDASAVLQSRYKVDADENLFQLGVAGKLNLYGYRLENNHSAAVYLQLFDKAAVGDVTLGTTVPDLTIMLPASGVAEALPLRALKHFQLGCIAAVTSARGNAVAPGADASVTIYFSQS